MKPAWRRFGLHPMISNLVVLLGLRAAHPPMSTTMKLSVYAGQACFIIVPDFLQPPAATSLYAPLRHIGYVDDRALCEEQIRTINQAITDSFYAIVGPNVVEAWWSWLTPDMSTGEGQASRGHAHPFSKEHRNEQGQEGPTSASRDLRHSGNARAPQSQVATRE